MDSKKPRRERQEPKTRKPSSPRGAHRDMPSPENVALHPAEASARTGPLGRAPLPAALTLLPYQRRWIEDAAPLKIVVKARQIGYSFAATLRVVFECLKRKTTWILLSKGERQSRLLMEKVQEHIQSFGIVAQANECEYFEGTTIKQLETRFPNGSVIYALPANPDTARGYSGNVTLDEFAFHADAEKIYSALYPSITRGYSLEVISTPNGQQGKFYELARKAGLLDRGDRSQESEVRRKTQVGSGGLSPDSCLLTPDSSRWSSHYCDIYEAVRQGLKINLQQLRAGCEDDAAWRQEFGCQFVSTAENFFSPELVASCLSGLASFDTPLQLLEKGSREWGVGSREGRTGAGGSVLDAREEGSPTPYCLLPTPPFFLGIDIGRKHDRTVFWIDEVVQGIESSSHRVIEPLQEKESSNGPITRSLNDSILQRGSISITRLVHVLSNVTFDRQLAYARELLSRRGGNSTALIVRAAIDATGMGAPLAESLAQEFGPRVEPVVFSAAVKEDLAYRTKRRMENGLTLLPDSRDIRRAFAAVKKFVTVSGNLRFDAERTDAGHADEFWAKALADLAAEVRPTVHLSDGYLAQGKPLISPNAFLAAGENWARTMTDFRF
jgi:phage FluMu gp28-like protein